MAKKQEKNISLSLDAGTFSGIFKRLGRKEKYDDSNVALFRQLLSRERARILSTIKNKNPDSIYNLAKLTGRDFKSVRSDVKLLEKFGFLELESKSKGKREMLKPILVVGRINITIEI